MRQPENASFDPAGRDAMVDLRGILLDLRARLGLIISITAAAAIAAAIFVFMVTPRFSGEAQLLLENRDTGFTRTLAERELPSGIIDEQAVLSQVQVVTSREVAREVIRRLGLVGNAEFDPLVGPMDPIARVRTMLGFAGGNFDGREEDRIFSAYYRALTVYAVPRSRVLAIEFRSADPELAARAANTIAEVYLEQLEEAQAELARAASTWLGANIEDLRARVSEAEAAVEAFRASSRLFLSGDSANISSQQLSDLNTRLADARSSQADAEARAQLINEMIAEGRAFEIPDVANNQLIGRLIEQRIDLRSRIALEQRSLLPAHPRIMELRAQLADLDEQITASAERTVRILENDARIAAARVSSLEAALDAQMSVVAQANESEVQLRALEREARAEREQLENYLTRYREAVARGTQNATLPDARVVSRAVIPNEPVFPRKAATIVLATLGAAFISAGGVVVAALVSGSGPAMPLVPVGHGHVRGRHEDYTPDGPFADPVHGRAQMDIRNGGVMSAQIREGFAYMPPHQPAAHHAGIAQAFAEEPLRHGGREGHHGVLPEERDHDLQHRQPSPIIGHDGFHEGLPEGFREGFDVATFESRSNPAVAESDEASLRPEVLPVDEEQRPVPGRRALRGEHGMILPQDERDLLTGVRALGARLRGTIAPGAARDPEAEPVDRVHPAAARHAQVEDQEIVQQQDRDEKGAIAEKHADTDPGDPAVAARQVPAAEIGGTVRPESVPSAATPVPPLEENRVEVGKSAARSRKKPVPDTWQELVDDAPVGQSVSARADEVEAGEGGDTDDSAVTVQHQPRLRRKAAARKGAADKVEADKVEADKARSGKARSDTILAGEPAAGKAAAVTSPDAQDRIAADIPAAAPGSGENSDNIPAQVNTAGHGAKHDDWAKEYDFGAMLARLRRNQRPDHGQRVLVSGLGDPARLRQFGEALAQAGAGEGRCILISMQDDGRPGTFPGLGDLIMERASFFDVIQRDPRSSLHRVERGRGGTAALIDDGDGLDVALTAFQHTYGLVFMLLPDCAETALLERLAAAADTVVIAADREADDPELVGLYARLAAAGPADVVVASVGRQAGVVAA